jgi:hypothetical protein
MFLRSLLSRGFARSAFHGLRLSFGRHQFLASQHLSLYAAGNADMKDEYGKMDSSGETYVSDSFLLESGERLKNATVRYNAYGTLNEVSGSFCKI